VSFTILLLKDPEGNIRRLMPKTWGEFYIQSLPAILKFENADKIVISGEQICERWTTLGTEYNRVK
jgi:hypothetical protein